MLRGESLRSIAMDWNERGVKTVGGGNVAGLHDQARADVPSDRGP